MDTNSPWFFDWLMGAAMLAVALGVLLHHLGLGLLAAAILGCIAFATLIGDSHNDKQNPD